MSIRFQEELGAAGIDFDAFARDDNQIKIQRKAPFPLEILVATPPAQPQPLGQILVLAPHPNRLIDAFASEVEGVLEAFDKTWPAPNRQVLSCDVALRCLYRSTTEHAFKEIWEQRLCQPEALLKSFGRPVLGGGLRFVMPPQPGESEPKQIEVKIESFLGDTTQVFVETQFVWPSPRAGNAFEPKARLGEVNQYITQSVEAFLMEGRS